ncbi:helix-turn-helix domain-containing protein [Nocardioides sp. R1-1]|uniref:helix-turn-helix domain-containing protein n=1 Tax=Nocardioides sp. R1-1 TaxID=3383502 RepID=UPI0038D12EC5
MTAISLLDRLPRRDDEDGARIPEWTLGDRLRKSMDLAGMGVGEMAEAFGVSRETVSRWLGDRTRPKKSTLWMWAAGCGVDLQWLETGEASPEAVRLQSVRHQGLEPRTR